MEPRNIIEIVARASAMMRSLCFSTIENLFQIWPSFTISSLPTSLSDGADYLE